MRLDPGRALIQQQHVITAIGKRRAVAAAAAVVGDETAAGGGPVEVGVGCMLLVDCRSEVVQCVVQAEGLASCLQLLPALLPAHFESSLLHR
jgi:hypothetical protein